MVGDYFQVGWGKGFLERWEKFWKRQCGGQSF